MKRLDYCSEFSYDFLITYSVLDKANENVFTLYSNCRARVAVELATAIGSFKEKRHIHPPPLPFLHRQIGIEHLVGLQYERFYFA
jgi:hypothetical protein